ncbi:MAG: hypothetical protein OC190_01625 [Novosphingobium aromaticivorans]|nr:hypothetical protein [Novosphingobium aromaticivorans]
MRTSKLATPLLTALACSTLAFGAPAMALANPPVEHPKEEEHHDKKDEHHEEHKEEHKEGHHEGHR